MKRNKIIQSDYKNTYYRHISKVNSCVKRELGDMMKHINIVRGRGYYYVHSNDSATALRLANLPTTSIWVMWADHQSLQQWIEDVRKLLTAND